MPKKKKSNKEKSQLIYQESNHLKRLLEFLDWLPRLPHLRRRRATDSGITVSGTTDSGTTKSWLTDSRRCPKPNQPHQYPQLIELTADSCSIRYRRTYIPWWKSPPPGFLHINILFESASLRSYKLNQNCYLVLTGVSNPAFMVYTNTRLEYWDDREGNETRLITHKSTEIDPYDANNQVMKFSYVIRSESDGKYYALSSQGALVVMEQTDAHRITVTGICKTRAVPSSSVSAAKYFKEYLFESRGEILLVFLIYKESINGLADEIEFYRLDLDGLKLVKVKRLQGRALFLEKERCIWVDAKEIGCKGDCVYFTGELGDGWWMYDMESGSISADCRVVPGIEVGTVLTYQKLRIYHEIHNNF